ncbi:MAG: glycoside hydrolase family 88 protein [Planctomycetota bacterium]
MRYLTAILLAVTSLSLVSLGGCEALISSLATPADAQLLATIVAGRYMTGEYPGTINSTLDDPIIVYHFTYTNGVSLWALMLLHEETGDAKYLEQVRASLAKYDADNLYRPDGGAEPIDYLGSMAHVTLEYHLRTGDQRYLANALDSAEYFLNEVARSPDGLIAYHSEPARGRIWADALFMVTPLLAKAGRLLNDSSYYDDVLHQFRGFSEKLRDPVVGLYHQGWNWHGAGASPGYWGRANGWVAVALTEVLDALPESYAGRSELLTLYQDFMQDVVAHQGVGGMWHQLLDRPDSYEETSCTAMFVYALGRGVQRGWLGPAYADAAEQGFVSLTRKIALDGTIDNICPGTGTQASEQAYFERGPRRNDSHGIGPVMLAIYAGMILPAEVQ